MDNRKIEANHLTFANEMMAHAEKEAKEIEKNKEEILRAFVAKYGFDPDHAMQITGHLRDGQTTWQVIHTPNTAIEHTRRLYLMSKVSKKRLNHWQKFCLFLATGKW